MKRGIAISVALFALVSALTGCSGGSLPSGDSNSDSASGLPVMYEFYTDW